MNAVRVLRALGPIDARSIWRDSLLRWMLVMAVVIGALLRWGLPPLSVRIAERFALDIVPHYPLVMSFVLLLMPILAGLVIGFLLLDERDDNTLSALQVTPLSLNGYLLYRIGIPMTLSVVLTLLVFQMADVAAMDPGVLLVMAVAAAPMAPIFALFLATFAANKVQGFALTKANGVVTLPPVIAYFVASDWQLAFGVVPTYWPAKAYWQWAAGAADFWGFLLAGVIFQVALLVLLVRRFNRVMRR